MQSHPNDPLHGVTLETVLRTMVDRYGWPELAGPHPDPLFHVRSDHQIQPHFPAENPVGARSGWKIGSSMTRRTGSLKRPEKNRHHRTEPVVAYRWHIL